MADVQYAPATLNDYYGSTKRHNSDSAFIAASFVPRTYDSNLPISSAPSSVSTSPRPSSSSLSTQASYASSNTSTTFDSDLSFEIDEDMSLPDFGYGKAMVTEVENVTIISNEESHLVETPISSSTPVGHVGTISPEISPLSDDISLRPRPTRHVDYLSHEWKEEDIWMSWRYIIGKRNDYNNGARLENASWRSWAKAKNNLKTVSPAKLNWLKDCDVTWLYGPLSTYNDHYISSPPASPNPQARDETSDAPNSKKPILKKRSMSEVLLQRSLSSSNLIKQAAASLESQELLLNGTVRPTMSSRTTSDFDSYPMTATSSTVDNTSATASTLPSGLQSPTSKKHIHFNNCVIQCIAKPDEEDAIDLGEAEDDGSSDEGLFLSFKPRSRSTGSSSARGSFSDQKTIIMLPSTTLKAVPEPAEVKTSISNPNLASYFTNGSSSSNTAVSKGSSFLYNDEEDDEELDIGWKPSGAFANRKDSMAANCTRYRGDYDNYYDEDEYGFSECPPTPPSGNEGIFGRAVDAVNTARDIAQVFWNVWPRR